MRLGVDHLIAEERVVPRGLSAPLEVLVAVRNVPQAKRLPQSADLDPLGVLGSLVVGQAIKHLTDHGVLLSDVVQVIGNLLKRRKARGIRRMKALQPSNVIANRVLDVRRGAKPVLQLSKHLSAGHGRQVHIRGRLCNRQSHTPLYCLTRSQIAYPWWHPMPHSRQGRVVFATYAISRKYTLFDKVCQTLYNLVAFYLVQTLYVAFLALTPLVLFDCLFYKSIDILAIL